MIPQEELTRLSRQWDININKYPEFRHATCVRCGDDLVEMFHIWHLEDGYKKEVHLCKLCGENYNLDTEIPQILIVIASHGRPDLLEKTLSMIHNYYHVLVIDTKSDKYQETKEVCRRYGARFCQTPFAGYDTGAYLWAYWNYNAHSYMFMHDSEIPMEPHFVKPFITGNLVVAYAGFEFYYDNELSKTWSSFYSSDTNPAKGIFGPIFYSKREALDKLKYLPPIPQNKSQAQSNERIWAKCFNDSGIQVRFLYDWGGANGESQMENGQKPPLRKIFLRRD